MGLMKTRGEKIFGVINIFILALVGLIMLFPFYVTAIHSLAPGRDFATKPLIIWPSYFDFSSYVVLIGRNTGLLDAMFVTVASTVIGTFINMLFTILGAVGLSNKKLPYRNAITLMFVFTMFFGGGIIPAYLLNKFLGLLNNFWVLVLPGAVNIMFVFYLRNFIGKIPHEIIESASIDGCSDMRMIWYIILPLSTASIATFSMFYAVGHWNDFFSSMMYITDPKKQNLQAYLMTILQDARNIRFNPEEMARLYEAGRLPPPSESLRAANVMAATLPIICVYPFLQKYFIKGFVVGSLKG